MKTVKQAFYVEFFPESIEELRTARRVFADKENNRSVFVVAAADYEQDDVIEKFNAAMKNGR